MVRITLYSGVHMPETIMTMQLAMQDRSPSLSP